MQPHKLELDIPDAIIGYLQMDDEKIKNRIYKLLLIDLVRRSIISFGKAAELVGVDKMSFINEMGHMGIPYYCEDISEVINDAKTIEKTMTGAS